MPIPTQPTDLFIRPFAADGVKQIIPDMQSVAGRASLANGFPAESQLPLSQGGIAPNRTDFNGILYMLSAFAFWQQSGGMFSYRSSLNYAIPAVVFHTGSLWWCVAPSGPDTGAGAVEPGTDDSFWMPFLQALAGGASISFGIPVGTVISYWGTSAPDGYLACDGSPFSATDYPALYALLGSALTPDLRGHFVRGYDTRNTVDPDGASRPIGSIQGDAIRNIEGSIINTSTALDEEAFGETNQSTTVISGAFSGIFRTMYALPDATRHIGQMLTGFTFSAAKVVPTAAENRPKNICLLYCIKHD